MTDKKQCSKSQHVICIEGLLVADKWDESGRVVSFALHTDDESQYTVIPDDIEIDLTKWLRQRIQVKGIMYSCNQLKIQAVYGCSPLQET